MQLLEQERSLPMADCYSPLIPYPAVGAPPCRSGCPNIRALRLISRQSLVGSAFVTAFVLLQLATPVFAGSPVSDALPKLSNILPLDTQKNSGELKAVSAGQQLETTRRELVLAEAERDRARTGLSGNSFPEAKEKYRLVDGLVTHLNSQINLINEREEVRRSRVVADQTAASWAGFTKAPPYSILMLDEIMSSVLTARAKSKGLSINQLLLGRQIELYRESAEQAREVERKTADGIEATQSSQERLAATRQKELAAIRVHNADILANLITLRYEVLSERRGVAGVELELLERQLAEARKGMLFSQADLNTALERLKAIRTGLEQELDAALSRDTQSRQRLMQSQQEQDSFTLRHSRSDSSTTSLQRRAEIEARQRAALGWVDSSRFETEVLSALITLNRSTARLWEQRYTALTGTDAEKRRVALADFHTSRDQMQPWLEFAKQQFEMFQAAVHDQERRLSKMPEQGLLRAAESDLLSAKTLQQEMAERQKAAVEQADIERQSWLEDIERTRQTRSITRKTKEWLGAVPGILYNVWRFELFAIEDSVEIAGQKVMTSRGVTVGKSVGAVLLFVTGYWIATRISRRVHQILISRFKTGHHQANVIRRWLMALTVFALLIITLNLARIPLTVFAFLGGALAIGVGFGTQTLIKNFISGILILLERNLKVGDTIDVDGVVGRIVTVDIRASTILGFDGVETVIPNSTFLENKVTNWTHTNARLRRSVRVGVSYGSPTQRVHDLLLECGNAHAQILKNQPLEALFEDFGDSSLLFALYFWIEHGPETNPLQIASDLRFLIEQRFTEEKIVFAFPQRDVHLDTASPLQIEVLPSHS